MKKSEKTFPTHESCASTVRESGSIVGINFADSVISPAETIVLVPVSGAKRMRLYKLSDLHKTIWLIDEADKLLFNEKYLSVGSGAGPTLLWHKLYQHDPILFKLLLVAVRPLCM